MIEEEANWGVVDELIQQKRTFALYHIPGEKQSRLLKMDSGVVRVFNDLKELNGLRGFVIAPFHIHKSYPVVLLQPDVSEHSVPMKVDKEDFLFESPSYPDEEFASNCDVAYEAHFDIFIKALRAKAFDKLVLSRDVTINKERDFSPTMAFRSACRRYVHSYIYLCYTPQTGLWLGSTPEIILSGEGNEWNTVALAGTQPLQNGNLPTEWDAKNRKEQEYVSSYIRSQLLSLGIHAEEKGPYPAFAGALSHLKTDFKFQIQDNGQLGDILNLLHPTPAVCGLPKQEAYEFILQHEGYDRAYYSGFIGWIDPADKSDLYVNLRCMHIEDHELTLYAGGGLLASSDLNEEWQETEKKLQTMRRIVTSTVTSHAAINKTLINT